MYRICYVLTISSTVKAFFIPQLKYLASNGFDVTVICSNDVMLQEELGDAIRFYPIEIPRGISFKKSIIAIKTLTKFFKEEQFDLIQYSTPNAAFYASIASKKTGCKVRNYHLMGLKYLGSKGIGRTILKIIEKITCNNSTSIECVSKSNMDYAVKEGLFPQEKATVVWNGSTGGVDLVKFDYRKRLQWRDEIRKELVYSHEDFVYGFVGRITKDKGINELLEAFFNISNDAKLFLIGQIEGAQLLDDELLDKAKKHPNIQFHESVTDIERYYAAIDVLLLPSYREGFGNVIIEAGAVGTPAIVSNIPGPIDIVEQGGAAIAVPVKDSAALADAMEQIRKMDYIEMGKNASKLARENYDSIVLCQKILERKKKLLRKSK